MDVDICGPSIPTILGIASEQVHASSSGWSPVYVQDNLGVMSVGFMLPSAKDAIMWRGPKKNGLISQFLKDVDWGDLDYLVVDTPPGTSDEHLSIVQYLKESGIDGAVVITTPQEVALQDVRREIDFCNKVGIRVLGLVENMSGFVCPNCKTESQIFKPSTGGGRRLAQDMGVEFLGAVPLDPRIGKSADYGVSFLDEYPESPASIAYLDIIDSESLHPVILHPHVNDGLRNQTAAGRRLINAARSCITHTSLYFWGIVFSSCNDRFAKYYLRVSTSSHVCVSLSTESRICTITISVHLFYHSPSTSGR